MIRQLGATIVTVAGLVAATVGGAPPASAADDFGQHVRTCAQSMGFDAEHNPGRHQGFAGWSPHHHC